MTQTKTKQQHLCFVSLDGSTGTFDRIAHVYQGGVDRTDPP